MNNIVRKALCVGIVLSLGVSVQNTLFCARNYSLHVPITRLTSMVKRRYYFVTRLSKTMKLLAKIKKLTLNIDSFFYKDVAKAGGVEMLFSHERIRSSVYQIFKMKSLKPLFMVWDDFASYKSIEDELLVVDFTKEIFVITKNTFLEKLFENKRNKVKFRVLADSLSRVFFLPPEFLIDLVCDMTSYLAGYYECCDEFLDGIIRRCTEFITPKGELADIKPHVVTEEVGTRYYYVKRLKESFTLLKKLEKKGISCLKYVPTGGGVSKNIFDGTICFSQAHVASAIKKTEETGDIRPIRILCKEVKHFKFIENNELFRQMLIAFFIAQKNAFVNYTQQYPEKARSATISQIFALYQEIDSLPIEEILTAIDVVSAAMNETFIKQDTDSGTQWKELFTKYWWVQPIIIGGTILLKIVKHYCLLSYLF